MFTKISVLIPTRGRIERLKILLASYALTTQGHEDRSDLVFRVDEDDEKTLDHLHLHRTVIGSRLAGYRSMPTFFNELALAAPGDVFMCGNDDMVFKTLGWAPRLLAMANVYPDGLFNLGVTTHNETHFPFSTISRVMVECLGYLWDPHIFWGDIYLRDVAAWYGRCVMVPDVVIDHDWIGFGPDKTFMEEDKDIMRTDPTYWAGTHATAVAEAVARLQPMFDASVRHA